jgi:hypothetical protein
LTYALVLCLPNNISRWEFGAIKFLFRQPNSVSFELGRVANSSEASTMLGCRFRKSQQAT